MALIAHYKLDGNENDSVGGYHGVVSGTVNYINAKIGQGFSTDAAAGYITTTINDQQFATDFSASAWVRIKAWGTSKAVFGTRNSPNGWMLYRNSGDSEGLLRFYMHYKNTDDVDGTFSRTYSSFPLDEWFHVVVVRGRGWIEIWFNGNKVASGDLGSNFKYWNTNSPTPLRIGAGGSGWTTEEMDIDDVRIYDHTLSPREVRDLAQAKVLHYQFNEFAEPTENVVQNLDMTTGWQTNYIQNRLFDDIPPPVGVNATVVSFENDDTTGDGYYHSYGDYAPQADGTTYQVSLWVKTDNPTDVLIRFYTADNTETDRYTSEDLTVKASDGWKRLVWAPFTTADPTDSDSLSFRYFGLYDSVTPAYTRLWLCAPQMEAKDHPTPFVDGIREDTVTDGSGQDNHLVNNTGAIFSSDSKTGSGAYEFDGVNDRLYTDGTQKQVNIDTDIAVFAWVKPYSTVDGARNIVTKRPGNVGWIIHNNATNALQCYVHVNGSWNNVKVEGIYTPNEWVHVGFTYDSTTLRVYADAVEVGSLAVGGPITQADGDIEVGGTSLYSQWWDGLIDDVRVYATALSPDEIQEMYQQRASLDSEGNLFPIQIQQSLKQDHGESEWYCVQSGTATYACVYDNTVIYEQSGSTITAIVTTGIDPQRGTFAITAGNRYFGSKPIHLMREGLQHQIVPISLMGTQFGHIATRNADGIYYIHATDQDATVDIFDNVANGVDGTPTSTVNVSAGSTSTYTTSTLSAWIFFQSENEVVISTEQDGVDQTILVPASKHMYRRMAENERTVKNNPPAVNAANLVSDTDPCVAVEIADAAGGDCTQGLGVENLSKIHAFGNTLSDYYIVAPYNNTIVQVLYWDGTSWILGEEHTLNGSLDSPDFVRRDGDSGFGVAGTNLSGTALNLGSDANIWKWVSNNPVHITINDSGANEDNLLGWMNDGY